MGRSWAIGRIAFILFLALSSVSFAADPAFPELPTNVSPDEILFVEDLIDGTGEMSMQVVEIRGERYVLSVPRYELGYDVGDVMKYVTPPEYGGLPNGAVYVMTDVNGSAMPAVLENYVEGPQMLGQRYTPGEAQELREFLSTAAQDGKSYGQLNPTNILRDDATGRIYVFHGEVRDMGALETSALASEQIELAKMLQDMARSMREYEPGTLTTQQLGGWTDDEIAVFASMLEEDAGFITAFNYQVFEKPDAIRDLTDALGARGFKLPEGVDLAQFSADEIRAFVQDIIDGESPSKVFNVLEDWTPEGTQRLLEAIYGVPEDAVIPLDPADAAPIVGAASDASRELASYIQGEDFNRAMLGQVAFQSEDDSVQSAVRLVLDSEGKPVYAGANPENGLSPDDLVRLNNGEWVEVTIEVSDTFPRPIAEVMENPSEAVDVLKTYRALGVDDLPPQIQDAVNGAVAQLNSGELNTQWTMASAEDPAAPSGSGAAEGAPGETPLDTEAGSSGSGGSGGNRGTTVLPPEEPADPFGLTPEDSEAVRRNAISNFLSAMDEIDAADITDSSKPWWERAYNQGLMMGENRDLLHAFDPAYIASEGGAGELDWMTGQVLRRNTTVYGQTAYANYLEQGLSEADAMAAAVDDAYAYARSIGVSANVNEVNVYAAMQYYTPENGKSPLDWSLSGQRTGQATPEDFLNRYYELVDASVQQGTMTEGEAAALLERAEALTLTERPYVPVEGAEVPNFPALFGQVAEQSPLYTPNSIEGGALTGEELASFLEPGRVGNPEIGGWDAVKGGLSSLWDDAWNAIRTTGTVLGQDGLGAAGTGELFGAVGVEGSTIFSTAGALGTGLALGLIEQGLVTAEFWFGTELVLNTEWEAGLQADERFREACALNVECSVATAMGDQGQVDQYQWQYINSGLEEDLYDNVVNTSPDAGADLFADAASMVTDGNLNEYYYGPGHAAIENTVTGEVTGTVGDVGFEAQPTGVTFISDSGVETPIYTIEYENGGSGLIGEGLGFQTNVQGTDENGNPIVVGGVALDGGFTEETEVAAQAPEVPSLTPEQVDEAVAIIQANTVITDQERDEQIAAIYTVSNSGSPQPVLESTPWEQNLGLVVPDIGPSSLMEAYYAEEAAEAQLQAEREEAFAEFADPGLSAAQYSSGGCQSRNNSIMTEVGGLDGPNFEIYDPYASSIAALAQIPEPEPEPVFYDGSGYVEPVYDDGYQEPYYDDSWYTEPTYDDSYVDYGYDDGWSDYDYGYDDGWSDYGYDDYYYYDYYYYDDSTWDDWGGGGGWESDQCDDWCWGWGEGSWGG